MEYVAVNELIRARLPLKTDVRKHSHDSLRKRSTLQVKDKFAYYAKF